MNIELNDSASIDTNKTNNAPYKLGSYTNKSCKNSIKKCNICGVTSDKKHIRYKPKLGMYLCDKHDKQYVNHGKFLDNNPISIFDRNKYYVYGNIALVECYDQYGNITRYFICDTEDIELVKSCKWRIVHKRDGDYVVTGNQNARKSYFHQDVLGKMDGMEVDHINHDTLDNRKSNLRLATSSDQKINQKIRTDNSTGFKGITHRKDTDTYMVDFQYKKVRVYFEQCKNLCDAVYFRYLMETKVYNKFRYCGNDENVFNQIDLISLKRKHEIEKYIDDKFVEYVSKGGIICE